MLSFCLYIEIFQCENKCRIFLQRFTVPDVSMTAYVGIDVADETNACLSICVTSRYDVPRFLKYCAKLNHNYRVTWSAHVRYILYHKLLVFFCLLRGMGVGPLRPNVNLILSVIVLGGCSTPMPCHFTHYLFQEFLDQKNVQKNHY